MKATAVSVVLSVSLVLGCGGGDDGGGGGDADGGSNEPDAGVVAGDTEFVLYSEEYVESLGDRERLLWAVSGTQMETLNSVPVMFGSAKRSPDGRYVTYTGYDSPDGDLRLIDIVDMSDVELTTDLEGDVYWSPDSTKLLFETAAGLSIADVDGTVTPISIAELGDGVRDARWTRSGGHVVYVTQHGTERRIHVVDANGAAGQQLGSVMDDPELRYSGDDFLLAEVGGEIYTFSPTVAWTKVADGTDAQWAGAQVLYVSAGDLRAVGRDGSGDHLVVAGQTRAKPSPDGTWVAWDDNTDVHLVGIDGTGDVTVSAGRGQWWSPDGAHLAFWSNKRNGSDEELYLSTADGTAVARASVDFAADLDVSQPQWLGSDVVRYDVMEGNRGAVVDSYLMIAPAAFGKATARRSGQPILEQPARRLSAAVARVEVLNKECTFQNLSEPYSAARDRAMTTLGAAPGDYREREIKLSIRGFVYLQRPIDSGSDANTFVCDVHSKQVGLFDEVQVCCYELKNWNEAGVVEIDVGALLNQ